MRISAHRHTSAARPVRIPFLEKRAHPLGLILGGAIGNLIDRIARGEVVDFLHFRLWNGYSWPDFNFADSFIVVGVGFLVLELLASEGETRTESVSSESGSSVAGADPGS